MSYRKLDDKGKPIPKKSIRKPAERLIRGVTHFHYEIAIKIKKAEGGYRSVRQRFWLPGDREAADKQRELKHEAPVDALTWIKAHELWLDDPDNIFSEGHIATSRKTIELWTKDFGADSTIEGTELADFTKWIKEKAKEGTGRAAQIKHEQLLAIARWCREGGLVTTIPFEHSPKPAARTKKRTAASIDTFHEYVRLLPDSMRGIWWMLGLSGARLTAVCELLEAEITDKELTVLTKFRERVPYPITDDIAKVIAFARKFKADHGIDSPFLFTKDNGRPWKKDYFNHRLHRIADAENKRRKDAAEEAGGEGAAFTPLAIITSHQLRHMAGTVSGEQGLSVDQIQALLAQKDRRSSEDYVDKTMKMRATGMKMLGGLLQLGENLAKKSDNLENQEKSDTSTDNSKQPEKTEVTCPCCGHKFIPNKE